MYPTFAQFSRWAAGHRCIPLWIEPQLPSQDLLDWTHSLLAGQSRFFLLHSASSGSQARYSYFSLDSPRHTAEVQDGSLYVRYRPGNGPRHESLKIGNPVDRFHQWLSAFSAPRIDGLPPFWGGAVGYFSYETASWLDPRLASVFDSRRGKSVPLAVEGFPPFEWAVYDAVGAVDHARSRLWLVLTVQLPEGRLLGPAGLEKIYRSAQDRLRRYAVEVQRAVRQRRRFGGFQAHDLRSNRSEAAYRLMVRRAKGFIESGDIYQANLSQTFSASWRGDPWALYRRLSSINPSPYAALWRSGTRWMVSASPELLLRQEADRIETRPIAGTWPRPRRRQDPLLDLFDESQADRPAAAALLRDIKERAEHIMLVDLERNDLGRICVPGSVRVAESLSIERYSHVLHLVSDVRGRLRPECTWRDTLAACFPGGTITGCPKIRSMELIHRLEVQRRGPYTGGLGWIGFTGDAALNILIRTIFLGETRLCFPVGAGIVADSDPAREYQETLHKARALLQALQAPVIAELQGRKRS